MVANKPENVSIAAQIRVEKSDQTTHSLSSDGPRTFVLREKRDVKLDHEIYTAERKATGVGPPSVLWLDWVEWEGPLHRVDPTTAVEPVIFANTNSESEQEQARAIIEQFARRAFRGKEPSATFIKKLTALYGTRRKAGDSFKAALKDALSVVLAMGSNGQTSSPVERGAWVLRMLLHEPPPPAPPNVPQLTRLEGQLLTTRERLASHQEEAQCSQCHRKIDPIGFGLENFNAIGNETWLIEASGTIHNGPAFKDYFELRDLIAAKPERIGRGFTEALIEYALGRPFGFLDQDLAAGIEKRSQAKDFAVHEFVQALVTSREFQSK